MNLKARVLKMLVLSLITLISSSFTFGQTANEFEKKFISKTYYEVRPKISIAAEFNKNGKVCRVSFQPNRISEKTKTTYLGENYLDLAQLKEAFDEVVPIQQREGKLKTNPYEFDGNIFWGILTYKNLLIEINGTTSKGNEINFCNLFGNGIKNIEKPDNYFDFCSSSGSLEFVTVTWLKRDCSKK